MSPTVALILASLYDRRKFVIKSKLFSVDEHLWAPQVSGLLLEMGFQEFLEMKSATDRVDHGHIQVLRLCSGEVAAGKGPGELQAALAALLPADEGQKLLYVEPYSGMFEAILNSHMWAYPADRKWPLPQPKRWWLTGAVDTKANLVTVIAYDQGVSIPAMLPAWKHYGRLRSFGSRLGRVLGVSADLDDPANDGLAIRLAMKIAKTSTGLPQHGKGLHTMVEVAERATRAKLRVLSRNGEFTWETGRKSAHRSFDHPIEGTLIEWRLQL